MCLIFLSSYRNILRHTAASSNTKLFRFPILTTMEDQLHDQLLRFYTATHCNTTKVPQWIYDLPPEKRVNAKSQFKQTPKPYRAGGILYHGEKEIVTKSRLPNILKACHGNPISGGHFGRDKTLAKISDRYYWKGMKNDVHQHVKTCQKCFVINPQISKEVPPLDSIPVAGNVWSLVRKHQTATNI